MTARKQVHEPETRVVTSHRCSGPDCPGRPQCATVNHHRERTHQTVNRKARSLSELRAIVVVADGLSQTGSSGPPCRRPTDPQTRERYFWRLSLPVPSWLLFLAGSAFFAASPPAAAPQAPLPLPPPPVHRPPLPPSVRALPRAAVNGHDRRVSFASSTSVDAVRNLQLRQMDALIERQTGISTSMNSGKSFGRQVTSFRCACATRVRPGI